MPMQPRPKAETFSPLLPNSLCSIIPPFEFRTKIFGFGDYTPFPQDRQSGPQFILRGRKAVHEATRSHAKKRERGRADFMLFFVSFRVASWTALFLVSNELPTRSRYTKRPDGLLSLEDCFPQSYLWKSATGETSYARRGWANTFSARARGGCGAKACGLRAAARRAKPDAVGTSVTGARSRARAVSDSSRPCAPTSRSPSPSCCSSY